MFRTSFPTTKTQFPPLCKKQILTYKKYLYDFLNDIQCISLTNFLSSLPLCGFLSQSFDGQVWWITPPSLFRSWLNIQSCSRPTTISSSPRNMRWVGQKFKGWRVCWVLISVWLYFGCKESLLSLWGKWLFLSSLFFGLVDDAVAGGTWAIIKCQVFLAMFFLRYIGSLKTDVTFNYVKFPLMNCCNSSIPKCSFG